MARLLHDAIATGPMRRGASRVLGTEACSARAAPPATSAARSARIGATGMEIPVMLRHVFQNVTWLAVELPAYGFERAETDGPGLTGLEDGEIGGADTHALGQFAELHLVPRELHVEVNPNSHGYTVRSASSLSSVARMVRWTSANAMALRQRLPMRSDRATMSE